MHWFSVTPLLAAGSVTAGPGAWGAPSLSSHSLELPREPVSAASAALAPSVPAWESNGHPLQPGKEVGVVWGPNPRQRAQRWGSSVSRRGTGNRSSPKDVSAGLCVGQAAWLLTHSPPSGARGFWWPRRLISHVCWRLPPPTLHVQALELQGLPVKRGTRNSCGACAAAGMSSPRLPGLSPGFPEGAACCGGKVSRELPFALEFWGSRSNLALPVPKAATSLPGAQSRPPCAGRCLAAALDLHRNNEGCCLLGNTESA